MKIILIALMLSVSICVNHRVHGYKKSNLKMHKARIEPNHLKTSDQNQAKQIVDFESIQDVDSEKRVNFMELIALYDQELENAKHLIEQVVSSKVKEFRLKQIDNDQYLSFLETQQQKGYNRNNIEQFLHVTSQKAIHDFRITTQFIIKKLESQLMENYQQLKINPNLSEFLTNQLSDHIFSDSMINLNFRNKNIFQMFRNEKFVNLLFKMQMDEVSRRQKQIVKESIKDQRFKTVQNGKNIIEHKQQLVKEFSRLQMYKLQMKLINEQIQYLRQAFSNSISQL